MENTTIRRVPLIITVVAMVAIVALLIQAKRHPVIAPSAPTATTTDGTTLCYALNKPTASGYNDIAYVKITSTDGGQHVSGELGTFLAEKDGMHGTIGGSVTSDGTSAIFKGQYISTGEGVNTISEQMIKLDQTQAQLGYGEMIKNTDGSYSYKNPATVTYSLTIPRVDCAQYDSLKTASN